MDKQLEKFINELINAELWSSMLYIDLRNYFEGQGMPTLAYWIETEGQKKTSRIHQMTELLQNEGGTVSINSVDYSPKLWQNTLVALDALLKNERQMSKLAENFRILLNNTEDPPSQILTFYLYNGDANIGNIFPELLRMLSKEGKKKFPPE